MRQILHESRIIWIKYGDYFDKVLVQEDGDMLSPTIELEDTIKLLEREAQWVPATLLRMPSAEAVQPLPKTEDAQQLPMCSNASPAQHVELAEQNVSELPRCRSQCATQRDPIDMRYCSSYCVHYISLRSFVRLMKLFN